ncbi:hypothetical protein Q3G72_022119 [Acer saccharum]|nr:hypothetical protein Q3G72_022119 [Acer saccharum]
MKNSLPFFLFFFFFLFFSSFADQSNETSFSFEGFDEDGENLNLEGALIMKPSGVLRLTKRSTNVTGHAFYAESIQMFDKTNTNASSFSTYFVFEIVPLGSDSGGHGLAFVLAPSAELPGAEPGHYLGILNSKNDELRPTMRQVMRYLSGDDDLPFVDDWSSADPFQPGSDHENRFLLALSRDTLQLYPQHWNSLPAGR